MLRGSASRFFQPPQPENLLLSSSPQARELSPFAETRLAARTSSLNGNGRSRPASSIGSARLARRRGGLASVGSDVADPNVFAGTTIIFPNAVARGRARGLDARLELIRHRSWSGYANLALGRVRQTGPDHRRPVPGRRCRGARRRCRVHSRSRSAGGRRRRRDLDSRAVRRGVSATIRYESGTPLEVSDEDEAELAERPGSELVDFDSGRVGAADRRVDPGGRAVLEERGRRSASIRASAPQPASTRGTPTTSATRSAARISARREPSR